MAGQPEKRFNSGLVKATVWKNTSRNGDDFRTVSLNRSYKDKEGNWKNTNSFGENDIDKAIDVLQQAQEYLNGSSESEEIVA